MESETTRELKESDILRCLEFWKNNCGNIMESQRKYNEEALEHSLCEFGIILSGGFETDK